MSFSFERKRINSLSKAKILEELEKAAEHFKYIEFSGQEFDKVSDVSLSAVKKHFGGWKKALAVLRRHLQQKKLDLQPRAHSPNRVYSDKDFFDEMERIWRKVGQRPSKTEWEISEPKLSYSGYKRRFGGWKNACLKFIEYKMGKAILSDDFVIAREGIEKKSEKENKEKYKREDSRDIPLGLRLKVLERDNFRCIFCGRSPAVDFGVKLHIDHIIPFSKSGKSSFENLQTLCEDCNLGKGNRKIE